LLCRWTLALAKATRVITSSSISISRACHPRDVASSSSAAVAMQYIRRRRRVLVAVVDDWRRWRMINAGDVRQSD